MLFLTNRKEEAKLFVIKHLYLYLKNINIYLYI